MLNFTQISNRFIGNIRLDAVTNEDHQSELSITENPIESGASIADHAVLQPKQVTITGLVVDYEPHSLLDKLPGAGNIRGGVDFLNHIPLPVKVITQTQQTIARANRLASQFSYYAKKVNEVVSASRTLAPWLPNVGLGNLLDNSPQSNRVQKCYADLIACQKSGETIDIQTGVMLYKNMLIQSVSVRQTQDGSAEFSITAREVFIVETATSSTTAKNKKNSPIGKKRSGRAATQGASKTQQGNTQPTPVSGSDKSSIINIKNAGVKLAGTITGLFGKGGK